jgi:hypothetical protein
MIAERIGTITRLFPGWVNKLIVAYDGSDKDVATIKPEYEYRFVTIILHRAFIEQDDWRESLIHEVAHSLVRPYVALVDRIVEAFVPETSKAFIYDELAKAEEAMVEDLAIFADKIGGAGGESL